MKLIRSVKGMNDIFPPKVHEWQFLEQSLYKTFSNYGFEEIRTPVLEELGLFERGVGESSDIVSKEMFVVQGSKETFCLRPEGTAAVVRALLQKGGMDESFYEKFFYMGPMFRKERPQKGRLRQFHQFGAEIIGVEDFQADAEIIIMVDKWLKNLGLGDNYELQINSLGSKSEREKIKDQLKSHLGGMLADFCPDCHERFHKNILRMFDCKNDSCQKILASAPKGFDLLGTESLNHFEGLLNALEKDSVSYKVNKSLVRGLDYYEKTVFEFISLKGLGAQNAIASGGRYDGLFSILGAKKDVPGIGFSGGFERVFLALEEAKRSLVEPSFFDLSLIFADEIGRKEVFDLAIKLREQGLRVDFSLAQKSVKSQMRRANKLNARWVVVIGESEVKTQKAVAKNFINNQEQEVSLKSQEILSFLKGLQG